MIICPRCGSENTDDSQFCKRCGASLAGLVPASGNECAGDAPEVGSEDAPASEGEDVPAAEAQTTVLPQGAPSAADPQYPQVDPTVVRPWTSSRADGDGRPPVPFGVAVSPAAPAGTPTAGGLTPGASTDVSPSAAGPAGVSGPTAAGAGPTGPTGPDLSYDAAFNQPRQKPGKGPVIAIVAVVAAALVAAFVIFGGTGRGQAPKPSSAPDAAVSQDQDADKGKQDSTDPGKDDASQPAPTTTTDDGAADGSGASDSQKAALDRAKDYLKYTSFSHDGLVDQLVYEGFSKADATFAADSCAADWNAQALKKAQDYLSLSAFSHDGLVGQLEYDKFTTDQATYAADNCGADWNQQAVECAKEYLGFMDDASHEDLVAQLVYEGFTQDQAEYGVTQAGK